MEGLVSRLVGLVAVALPSLAGAQQVRLAAHIPREAFQVGETIELTAMFVNEGKSDVLVARQALWDDPRFHLVVRDGRWTRAAVRGVIRCASEMLMKDPRDSIVSLAPGSSIEAAKRNVAQWVNLTRPGHYWVTLVYEYPVWWDQRQDGVPEAARMTIESDPIEIRILEPWIARWTFSGR